jgi:hypothetical protein
MAISSKDYLSSLNEQIKTTFVFSKNLVLKKKGNLTRITLHKHETDLDDIRVYIIALKQKQAVA